MFAFSLVIDFSIRNSSPPCSLEDTRELRRYHLVQPTLVCASPVGVEKVREIIDR